MNLSVGYWKPVLWVVLLLGSGVLVQAETVVGEHPSIRLPRVAAPPTLREYLDPHGEHPGLRISGFRQREPNDGAPALLDTTAFLSYDAKNIYAVFICKEDRRLLRAHVSRREEILDDDRVSIALDTFHDGRRAYEFFVNPLGVQREGIITEGQDDDFSFDTLWHSEAQLTSDGFVALIAIPFRSLRFNPSSSSTWGIALGRYSPATKEFSTWPHLTEKVEAYVAQFANLDAIAESSPARNLQLIPYLSFAGQRFLNLPEGAPPAMKTENEVRGGVDAKFVWHDALTFDFTANPDFSQVESDEPQVTVNRRYEVFFPEKRPFFTEGTGFFQTPENLFFSRRIADPQFGLRMTGKVGAWALGMLAADDRAPGRSVAPTDPLAGDRAAVGVFRVQRELGQQSTVGLLFSRRQFGSASNDVFSFDTRLKVGDNWVFAGQAVHSRAREQLGDQLTGSDYFAEIRHTGLHLNYSSSYLDRSPNFRADLGFIPRVDTRKLKNEATYQWRPEGRSLVSLGPALNTYVLWDHRGQLQEWLVDAPFTLAFKGPTSLSVGHLEEFERFQGIAFRENATYIDFSTQRLKWVGIEASFTHGTNINYFAPAELLPFLANADDASVGFTLRPNSRVRIDETYLFSRLATIPGRSESARSPVIFDDHLLRTKLNYQFTRSLSLRAILDYNTTLPNPALVDLERSKHLTADILLTYLLHPGTAIYLGYTDRRENLAFDPSEPTGLRRTGSPSFQTGRQLFIKMSYLFRF